MDLATWACPVCHSPMREEVAGMQCIAEGRSFGKEGGIPVLLRPEDEPLRGDAQLYAHAWKQDKFAPRTDRLADLPYIKGEVWSQKARSMEALLRELGPAAGRSVADVGAGTGWLSHRLAEAGFRCFATDISGDAQVGLGAVQAFAGARGRLEAAIATLSRWPLRSESIDVAICNASLHHLPDIRPAVAEASRVLRSSGVFVVMNDPVHEDPRSAARAAQDFRQRLYGHGGGGQLIEGHRHFVAAELRATLEGSFVNVRRVDPDYGFAFRAKRSVKGRLLRMELASFALFVAKKP